MTASAAIRAARRRLGVVVLVIVVSVACLAVAGCGGSGGRVTTGEATASSGGPEAADGLGPITLSAEQQQGEALFKSTCGSCHTLGAAGTKGTVGPNLDMLRPPAAAVSETIETGLGAMPAELLKGKEADAVAEYVAAVTAH